MPIKLIDLDKRHAASGCPMPCRDEIHQQMEQLYKNLDKGVVVYLRFLDTDTGFTEAMWVQVTEPGKGTLDNDPQRVAMKHGDLVEFEPCHVETFAAQEAIPGLTEDIREEGGYDDKAEAILQMVPGATREGTVLSINGKALSPMDIQRFPLRSLGSIKLDSDHPLVAVLEKLFSEKAADEPAPANPTVH
jgi:hypothetical protein